MQEPTLGQGAEQAFEQVLGYLNFSSGAEDPRFLDSLNQIFEAVADRGSDRPTWELVGETLSEKVKQFESKGGAFAECGQVRETIELVYQGCLPGYLEFHKDLLYHQSADQIFNSFFVGRVFEAVLSAKTSGEDRDEIVDQALHRLNDYVGYRPLAVLESRQLEPYRYERFRPIPLFVKGAGFASGPYQEILERAIEILESTDLDILDAAYFRLDALHEIAVDCRAYDFDHPANKRPNYHFGQWDPDQIDNKGRFRRYIIQQVTLNALASRVDQAIDGASREELLFEASSVLAGTMLMATGISGDGPGAHHSTVTLTELLPQIAWYRDEFYTRLLQKVGEPAASRLRIEAEQLQQPFGGARQHLNAELARLRASQLEHVHLAMVFARMGFPDAAKKQVDVVPVASARMMCEIDCCLSIAFNHLEADELDAAFDQMPKAFDLLHRAIECGAMMDPWNILGFDANFSLFPAMENSVRDHRADELVALMEQLFACYSRLWSEAAARDHRETCERIDSSFEQLSNWWRKFAAHETSCVDCVDPLDAYNAAKHVASALQLWHKGETSSGDVAFWANHAEMFDSPKAYVLVIEALIQRKDFVASMALIIHWLSNSDQIPLRRGDCSFNELVFKWLGAQQSQLAGKNLEDETFKFELWRRLKKFLDYLEVNAGELWNVPSFHLTGNIRQEPMNEEVIDLGDEITEDEEQDEIFSAAYENVVFRDSTDDGMDGSIFDSSLNADDQLEETAEQIAERLAFHDTVSHLWKTVSSIVPKLNLADDSGSTETSPSTVGTSPKAAIIDNLNTWLGQAEKAREQFNQLIVAVENFRLPKLMSGHESLMEYDRQRLAKENLLVSIIQSSVENEEAFRVLQTVVAAVSDERPAVRSASDRPGHVPEDGYVSIFCAVLHGDVSAVRTHVKEFASRLAEQPLLYVPLSKGGRAKEIVAVRIRQQTIKQLLELLPNMGLLVETNLLLDAARRSEREVPVGHGAVTEFDELFQLGYRAMIECLVRSSERWTFGNAKNPRERDQELFNAVEKITEIMLSLWLAHSQTLRLSVLEKTLDKNVWNRLVDFIQRYGKDLFTQRFFGLGNLRAILHQGVESWLDQIKHEHEGLDLLLLEELDERLDRDDAVRQITLILEAIIENYTEYRDYNSTTTQSDRGELLYMLLDFLRLGTRYDRVAWHLRPVIWSHEILVRHGKKAVARRWRRSVTGRIGEEPEKYLERLARLQKKYAMRMPTIADRIGERFVQPMQIDRIRALVAPSMKRQGSRKSQLAFEMLEQESELLASEPTGAGLDVPAWLTALEEEVAEVTLQRDAMCPHDAQWTFDPTYLSLKAINKQLDTLKRSGFDP